MCAQLAACELRYAPMGARAAPVASLEGASGPRRPAMCYADGAGQTRLRWTGVDREGPPDAGATGTRRPPPARTNRTPAWWRWSQLNRRVRVVHDNTCLLAGVRRVRGRAYPPWLPARELRRGTNRACDPRRQSPRPATQPVKVRISRSGSGGKLMPGLARVRVVGRTGHAAV
jgi:hypothetical protein